MVHSSIRMTGHEQLLWLFGELPKRMTNSVVRNALSAGGVPIRDAARKNAMAVKDTGLLAKSIKIKHARKRYKHSQMVTVGPCHMKRALRRTKKGTLRGISKGKISDFRAGGGQVIYYDPGNYGHLVEFGTKAHTIAPKNKKAMRMPDGRVRTKPIHHCGTQGIGFMRRATDANAGRALSAVNAKLLKGMNDYINSHRPR
jgi:HK97 gp10 family phage protein